MQTRRRFTNTIALAMAATAMATGALAKSCLWKVTSPTGTLYLQGSIHVLKADNYPLAPSIETAYTASDMLVLEVDMKEMTAPATQQKLMAKATLSDKEELHQLLDAQTYRMLSNACDQTDIPIAALARFKPWYATMTTTLRQLQKMGFSPQYGLDTYFFGKAETDGKKVVGLESFDFQIELLDRLTAENPNEFVTRALADLALIKEDIASLETAWETGDIETLGTLISKSFEDYPDLYKTFVLDRNTRWLEALTGMLKTGTTPLVVVGAGHLSGPGGLLELLKKSDCILEQL